MAAVFGHRFSKARIQQYRQSPRARRRGTLAKALAAGLLMLLLPVVVVVLCFGGSWRRRAAAFALPNDPAPPHRSPPRTTSTRTAPSGNSRCSTIPRCLLFQCPPPALVWTRKKRKRFDFVVPVTALPTSSNNEDIGGGIGIGIGIDLGTTYSAVAYLHDGAVPTIVPVEGERMMPSVVRFPGGYHDDGDGGSDDDRVVVGRRACPFLDSYRNFKRVIGTGGKVPDEVVAVVPHLLINPKGASYRKNTLANQLEDAALYPTLLLVNNTSGDPAASLRGGGGGGGDCATIRPEVLSSLVVHKLKRAVEAHVGEKVTRAVIGVPAYFNDAQREATVRAAQLAGIEKVKLIREPEAAALAYRNVSKTSSSFFGSLNQENDSNNDVDELIIVFDLGGGTYDVSALVMDGDLCTVLCTSGDARLGGTNWDDRIARHWFQILRELEQQQEGGSTRAKDWSPGARNAVLLAAERARIHLSNNRLVRLALPRTEQGWEKLTNPQIVLLPPSEEKDSTSSSEAGNNNATHVFLTMNRREMESLCREEFQALLRPLREVAIMAGAMLPGDASPTLVDNAFKAEAAFQSGGGDWYEDFYSTSEATAAVGPGDDASLRRELEDLVLRHSKKAQQGGRKKARDVAKQERRFRAEKRKLPAISAENAKVRDGISGRPISRVVLVGGATRMPGVGRLIAALTGVAPQRTINPDEAVALGCAVQVGVLDGSEQFGKVLNPMQAAILRAMAEQSQMFDDDDNDENDDF